MLALGLSNMLGAQQGPRPASGYAFVTTTNSSGSRVRVTTTNASGSRKNLQTRKN